MYYHESDDEQEPAFDERKEPLDERKETAKRCTSPDNGYIYQQLVGHFEHGFLGDKFCYYLVNSIQFLDYKHQDALKGARYDKLVTTWDKTSMWNVCMFKDETQCQSLTMETLPANTNFYDKTNQNVIAVKNNYLYQLQASERGISPHMYGEPAFATVRMFNDFNRRTGLRLIPVAITRMEHMGTNLFEQIATRVTPDIPTLDLFVVKMLTLLKELDLWGVVHGNLTTKNIVSASNPLEWKLVNFTRSKKARKSYELATNFVSLIASIMQVAKESLNWENDCGDLEDHDKDMKDQGDNKCPLTTFLLNACKRLMEACNQLYGTEFDDIYNFKERDEEMIYELWDSMCFLGYLKDSGPILDRRQHPVDANILRWKFKVPTELDFETAIHKPPRYIEPKRELPKESAVRFYERKSRLPPRKTIMQFSPVKQTPSPVSKKKSPVKRRRSPLRFTSKPQTKRKSPIKRVRNVESPKRRSSRLASKK